jgi:hypothetical protein
MSSWYPNVETYSSYLSKNSYVRDITGQIIRSGSSIQDKISKQTYEIVAGREQMSNIFGQGFNKLNDTLEYGFDRLESSLQNVNASIDSLHSDFVYGMGLLIAQMQMQNNLLHDLIDKIDAIQKTLQNPALTKSREYYRLGCERFRKGLLDKALEAFLEAEEANDTDYFTQYNIGVLYLYGKDGDNDIVDLEKAKQHLLMAARYAKAEIKTDPAFTKLAAEALFNASLSVYFQLGDEQNINNHEKTVQQLNYCLQLAEEAVKLNPGLSEGYYHIAIYSALLNEPAKMNVNLNNAIAIDRNYAIKAGQNKAFDGVRIYISDLLSNIKTKAEETVNNDLNKVNELYQNLTTWQPEKSSKLLSAYKKCKDGISKAKHHCNYKTYFGFLDAMLIAKQLLKDIPGIIQGRIQELDDQVKNKINEISGTLPLGRNYRNETRVGIAYVERKLSELIKSRDKSSYSGYQKILADLDILKKETIEVKKQADEEDNEKEEIIREKKNQIRNELEASRSREKQEAEYERIQGLKNLASRQYAGTGAFIVGMIGSFAGCISCNSNGYFKGNFGDFNFLTGGLMGLIAGAILGAILGQIKDVK